MARQLATLFILLTSLHLGCADPAPSPSGEDAAPDLVTSAPDAAPDLAPPPAKPIGATCQEDAQCADGACLLDPKWPSGYCTTAAMDAATCTSIGGVQLATSEQEQVCARFCATSQDCRFGYACYRDRDTKDTGCLPTALVPAPPVVVVTPQGNHDGAACADDSECLSGKCLLGERWPGGYCSIQPCGVNALCNDLPDAQPVVCAQPSDIMLPTCLTVCREVTDCRAGYQCAGFDGVNRYCIQAQEDTNTFGGINADLDTYPIPIRCEATTGARSTLSYTIAPGQAAHALVVFSPSGQIVKPTTITNTAGSIYLPGTYGFHLEIEESLHAWLKVLILPGPPGLATKHAPGNYKLTVDTYSPKLCWYVLPHAATGHTIHVNIYLPGHPEVVTPTQLAGLSEVIEDMQAILTPHQITLRTHIIELPEEAHTELSYIRRERDISKLTMYSARALENELTPLAVNLFLVRGFADPNLLGRSQGLPGAPGLHATSLSSVIATAPAPANREAQQILASTIIHEIGHYLGLRHTTEYYSGADPLEDTPLCTNIRRAPDLCLDASNLMFPFNLGSPQILITPGQLTMLRANPLIQP
jgi:hypothetical protein